MCCYGHKLSLLLRLWLKSWVKKSVQFLTVYNRLLKLVSGFEV